MIKITRKHRYLLSLLSGLLMVISFPYTGSLTPLVFFSWVPLLIIENNVATNNYRSSKVFIHALITFFVYNLGTTWWVWNADEIGASMAIILNTIFMAIVFQFFHITKKYLGKSLGFLSLLFYWISFEYIHYHWELSWPWLHLGNVFSITPSWVQWYSITGVHGGSVWVLLSNFLSFELVFSLILNREGFQKNKKRISLVLSVILLPIIFSLVTYYTYTEKVDPLNIVIIQPNIDPYNEKFDTPVVEQLEKMCNLAEEKVTKNTDLVVAPETAISEGFYEEDARFMPSVSYLIKRKKEWGIPNLLIGASTARTFEEKNSRASRPLAIGEGFIEFYNTSLLIDEGDDLQFIHKSLLVPGAEIIPFSDYFPFLEELAIHNGGIKGSLGIEKKPKTFVSNDLKISSLICYESTCGQILAKQCKDGAEAVFVITNDGWWKDTPGYKQHMSFSRLRAIESRRYVARAANTGTSCIINQRGDVLQQTDWWVPAVLSGTINKNSELTIYSSFASEIWGALPWSSLIFLIFAFYKLFKKKVLG